MTKQEKKFHQSLTIIKVCDRYGYPSIKTEGWSRFANIDKSFTFSVSEGGRENSEASKPASQQAMSATSSGHDNNQPPRAMQYPASLPAALLGRADGRSLKDSESFFIQSDRNTW